MHECDAFIAFATRDYGENTGNSAATDKELDFWQSYMMRKGAKTLIPVRMIPWGEEFDFLAARVLFNMNNIVITWIKGDDMPPTIVKDILESMIRKGMPLEDILEAVLAGSASG